MEQRNVKSYNHKANNSIFGNVFFASLNRLVHLIWHHRRGKWKLKQDKKKAAEKLWGIQSWSSTNNFVKIKPRMPKEQEKAM